MGGLKIWLWTAVWLRLTDAFLDLTPSGLAGMSRGPGAAAKNPSPDPDATLRLGHKGKKFSATNATMIVPCRLAYGKRS